MNVARTTPIIAPSESAALGSALIAGRYTVLEQLGAGGMGVVCRVHDEATGKQLGLKRLFSAGAGRRRAKLEALFEREYHTLARLTHPRIIEVYEYGVTENGPFYTMELLEGGDLQELAPLPWREACRIICDVASSLALLHAHRMVHRDVAPRNIRLTGDGRAKLIDFGALSPFGLALDLVGTPLCMPPEVLQRGLLDRRTDLFALGVAGYVALTGKYPFSVRKMEDLPQAWKQRPPPPSYYRAEIPAEVDHLIVSMLDSDPLARPPHAAEVIDRLSASAGLDVGDYDHSEDSYLASHCLVGRQAELDWLEHRIERAIVGHGAEVLVTGVAGSGKTRLLREIGLDARLRGMCVMEADAQATSGYFGLAVALGRSLLDQGGAIARDAAHADTAQLAQLSPQLQERLGEFVPEPLAPNLAEQRSRFQAALTRWFLHAAQAMPLLLLVDNLQAADESSATFIALLGQQAREHKLLLVCSLRGGEPVRSAQVVEVFARRSAQRALEPIDLPACETLVESLFGEVDNSRRLAKLLYEKSAGNPQHLMELAHLLVRKQIARYAGGAWVLPTHVSSEELPDRLEDLFAARIASLSPAARDLAQFLAVHPKPVSLELCIASAQDLSDAQAHMVLDELMASQILACADDQYTFAQQGLRTTLLASLGPERARCAHRHAAAVLERYDDLELRMQRGWHLLSAGEERAGADLLANTSRAFLYTPSAREESQSVIAALRAALAIYERHGRSPHERAALLFPLVLLGYYCPDSRLILEHAPMALEVGRDITGLGLAERLSRFVEPGSALRIGMWWAKRRFAREHAQRGVQMTLPQAIAAFGSVVPASIGAFGCHYDVAGAERACALAEPLGLFPNDELPALIHAWVRGQLCMVHGLESSAHACISEVLASLEEPSIRASVGDAHWRSLRGGALWFVGISACCRGDDNVPEIAEQMEGVGLRLWALNADQLRLLYHTFRGEAERVAYFRKRVEWAAMQGGPTWQSELFWPAVRVNGEILCCDTIALRRTFQQLERTAQTWPAFRVHADGARAAYLSLRAEHDAAIALYEQVLRASPPRRSVAWLPARGHFAAALNRAGEHARAEQLLAETLAHVDAADRATRVLCFEVRRQQAVAAAALGRGAEANAMLDALLLEYEVTANPLLLGLLHTSRTQGALDAGDKAGSMLHMHRAQSYFRSTKHPLLIARAARLRQQVADVLGGELLGSSSATVDAAGSSVSRSRSAYSLAELSVASDRPRYALELLIARANAKGGCLYLYDGRELQLMAASALHEPPRVLEEELLLELQRSQSMIDAMSDPDGDTHVYDSLAASARPSVSVRNTGQPAANDQVGRRSQPSRPASVGEGAPQTRSHTSQTSDEEHYILVLAAEVNGQLATVGGVILIVSPGLSVQLDGVLLRAVGQALSAA